MAKHRAPRPRHLELAGVTALAATALLAAAGWTHATPTELGAGVGPAAHTAPAPVVDRSTLTEDDPGWACWVDGNGRCSTVPLDGPGLSVAPSVQPVAAVCSTDADCAAYDLARGVVSDGRP